MSNLADKNGIIRDLTPGTFRTCNIHGPLAIDIPSNPRKNSDASYLVIPVVHIFYSRWYFI